jgi:hypothetical protein
MGCCIHLDWLNPKVEILGGSLQKKNRSWERFFELDPWLNISRCI